MTILEDKKMVAVFFKRYYFKKIETRNKSH